MAGLTDEQIIAAVQARKEAAAKNTLPAFGADNMDASNVMKARELDSGKGLQALDDAARTIAGPAGDALAGVMQNPLAGAAALATGGAALPPALSQPSVSDDVLVEAVKSRKAAERLNANVPGSADTLGTMGDVGKVLALPGAAFSTPLKAMATGAVLSDSDTLFSRLQKGEPINTEAEQYISSSVKGAASGFLGYHIGKLIGNTVSRLSGHDPSLTADAEKAFTANKKITDEANAKVLNSGVAINPMGQNKLLHRLEKDLGKKYEVSPQITPKAWKALNILRDRVAQGAEISLDNFLALRDAIGKSLYSDSGLLARDVGTRDLQIVDDIYKSMNKFVSELPITPQFVRSGGDLKAGMQGYQQLTKFKQTQARSEKIAELITNAEAKVAGGGAKRKSIEQALQEEFGAIFTKGEGRAAAERMFTPEQLAVMKRIANGDISQKAFSTLDKWLGSSLIAPIFRAVRSLHGAAFQAEESRNLARKVISAVGETPAAKSTAKKLGVATVVEALKHL